MKTMATAKSLFREEIKLPVRTAGSVVQKHNDYISIISEINIQ